MGKCTLGILSVFLVAVIIPQIDCQKWNNGRQGSGRNNWRNGYSDEMNVRPPPMEPPPPSKSTSVKRGGIGAWGYVTITLVVILSGLGVYYTIIFYPIVCKKQRMYHVMGSTTVSVACLVPVGEEGREGGRPLSGTNEGSPSYAVNFPSQTTL